ncbi:MAG: patatin-like phospholipase family protein [Candidatus Krumholzibacteriota bacterium]|nr:patatin-like phospholipase family protein [Candidatus Krumholzibacteriota bacterium]
MRPLLMIYRMSAAILLIIFFLPVAAGGAADTTGATDEPGRPKIGLVLGGGGARGPAHIAAIRLLEELRIPVDYIAGTSAGSIVAGLYAVGLSPDEMENVMISMNWADLFSDRRDRRERSFRRKKDDRCDFILAEFGFKDLELIAPIAVVGGQKMQLASKSPFLHTTTDQDFDDLKIPLRTVATDLLTGEEIICSSGSLIHAIRSSMSIPGVFAPVHMDGRYLVDGGLVNILPVDVVKDMGADIIIAVDLGAPIEKADHSSFHSLLEVSDQTTGIMIRKTSEKVKKLADVCVNMVLEGYSSYDFELAPEVIQAAALEVEAYRDELSRFSVSEEEYERYIRKQRHDEPVTRYINKVKVENHSHVRDGEILRRISFIPGDEFDLDVLEKDLEYIHEMNVFETVDYRLVDEGGETVLLIIAWEKIYSPNILNAGYSHLDDLEGNVDFQIINRYTRMEINRLGGEFRLDTRLGISRSIKAEFYQPIEFSRSIFLAPWLDAATITHNYYSGDHREGDYETSSLGGGVDLGFQLGRFLELRCGFERRLMRTDVKIGNISVPEGERTKVGLRASIEYDLLDELDFPTCGSSVRMTFFSGSELWGGSSEYEKISLDFAQFATFNRNTFFMTFSGGGDFDSKIPFDEEFLLGGPHSFSGLKPGQLRGDAFGVARLGYYRPVYGGGVMFNPSLFVGCYFEAGNIWQEQESISADGLLYGGSVFIGLRTFLAPAQISYGRTENGYDSFYLTVGRQFGCH